MMTFMVALVDSWKLPPKLSCSGTESWGTAAILKISNALDFWECLWVTSLNLTSASSKRKHETMCQYFEV